MKFKGIKPLMTAAMLSTLLTSMLNPGQAQASPSTNQTLSAKAYINSEQAYGDVLIRQGTTFITLTDLKSLEDYVYKYDNNKKQITMISKDTTVVLSAGSKHIRINGSNKSLYAAPFLNKGKTMIPLRAVADAFHAKIYWNASTKTAYIAKADAKVLAGLKSDKLVTARNAAIKAPRISLIPKPLIERTYLEMQGVNYYFPKHKADRYFELDNDLISYYEIRNSNAELKWQAKVDSNKGKNPKSDLFFLPFYFMKEIGKQPNTLGWTVAQFNFRYPVGSTYYSMLNSNDEFAFGDVELDNQSPDYQGVIVEIPEESDSE